MQTVTRTFEFDAAHRLVGEKSKCGNLHGHRWKVEAVFSYQTKSELGYAINFTEIKRIFGSWIDDHLDHAAILNPYDENLIMLCKNMDWRYYVMGMGNFGNINPTAENMANELVQAGRLLIPQTCGVQLEKIQLYETPNCWVETDGDRSLTPTPEYLLTFNA